MEKYTSALSLLQTQSAIRFLRHKFEDELCDMLSLSRVSAPMFVSAESGLNDNLNGVERPVSFDILETGKTVEIVHSLAKWKRYALYKYGFEMHTGLYTDMNAIRRDETCDSLHSIYVDQWDWEKVIGRADRNEEFLKETVRKIYTAILVTAAAVTTKYPCINHTLPRDISFVTTQELEDTYPELTPKERENMAAKKYGAVFIMKIGGKLKSGIKHDGRAPDYDDWELNGDIVLYSDVLDSAFEISSMGIRVDEESLIRQLKAEGAEDRLSHGFHKLLLEGKLPYTVGGGIGQSRLSMFLLKKAHIGEVQASVWPQSELDRTRALGIELL